MKDYMAKFQSVGFTKQTHEVVVLVSADDEVEAESRVCLAFPDALKINLTLLD